MDKLDKVSRIRALDAMLVYLEAKHHQAIQANNVQEMGRVGSELSYARHERERLCESLTPMEDRRYEVECEERHE